MNRTTHKNRGKNPTRGGREPFPEEVAEMREACELTQQQAADLIYVSMRTWQDWEAGIARMRAGAWQFFLISVGEKDASEQLLRYEAMLRSSSGKYSGASRGV